MWWHQHKGNSMKIRSLCPHWTDQLWSSQCLCHPHSYASFESKCLLLFIIFAYIIWYHFFLLSISYKFYHLCTVTNNAHTVYSTYDNDTYYWLSEIVYVEDEIVCWSDLGEDTLEHTHSMLASLDVHMSTTLATFNSLVILIAMCFVFIRISMFMSKCVWSQTHINQTVSGCVCLD